jgi:quinol-cytochrome oxidoreductase complex cytochrome b subunit
MNEALKHFIDTISNAWISFALLNILFIFSLVYVKVWRAKVGAIILFVVALGCVWGFSDDNFKANMGKPDNAPIFMMIFIFGAGLWAALSQAIANDERIAAGKGPAESETSNTKTWVWPDLVYIEFLAMIIVTVLLVAWSLLLQAPLEEPANPGRTPNPSKAPWYFLGLQELLRYFHPLVAGISIPTFILVGLMAVPYVDRNPSVKPGDRKIAITLFTIMFMFGATLTIIGSFFRGPGYNWVWPWAQGLFFEL